MMTTTSTDVIDLFGGPGGWSLACRELGLSEVGAWKRARAGVGHDQIEIGGIA